MNAWPSWPVAGVEERERLEVCLASGSWSRGSMIEGFESAFAAHCGARHAVLVSSGTAALVVGLAAVGVGPGDEVIVPGLTWPSTALAVVECGATAVVVDVEPDTYAISVEAVKRQLTRRTRAVVPVHLFCSTADMQSLLALGREYGVAIVEDAAQGLGCQWQGRALGTLGRAGAFSFQQKKQLTCGEGGCLITDDEAVYRAALALRDHGHGPNGKVAGQCGSNHRLSALAASVLFGQLERLPAILERERENGESLTRRLDDSGAVRCLRRRPEVTSPSYYSFCLRPLPSRAAHATPAIRERLGAKLLGAFTGPYPPLDDIAFFNPQSARRYQGLVRFCDLGNCHRACAEGIRFPHQYLLAPSEQLISMADTIVETVRTFAQ